MSRLTLALTLWPGLALALDAPALEAMRYRHLWIAYSLILEANPLTPELRQTVQTVTQTVLADISKLNAARCCQRDSWIAFKKAAELSEIYLPVPLHADHSLVCLQKENNKHCFGKECPLF